jgi:hypothetical protein
MVDGKMARIQTADGVGWTGRDGREMAGKEYVGYKSSRNG